MYIYYTPLWEHTIYYKHTLMCVLYCYAHHTVYVSYSICVIQYVMRSLLLLIDKPVVAGGRLHLWMTFSTYIYIQLSFTSDSLVKEGE